MLRLLLLMCLSLTCVTGLQPAWAGFPHLGCHHCDCKHGCCKTCKTEVIYITPKSDRGPTRAPRDERAPGPAATTPVVASYPAIMPMMPMMYPSFPQPVQYTSYQRPPVDERAPATSRDCCDELRGRVSKVEQAIQSIDARLGEVEEILKLQTQLLKQMQPSAEGQ